MKLSIVIPTGGRASLYATLHSVIRAGISRHDEVIVVGDGRQEEADRISSFFTDRFKIRYVETKERHHNYGHGPSNLGYSLAVGTHIARMDDDDTYTDGVFQKIRAAADEHPDKILMFKMKGLARRLSYDLLWKEKEVRLGNIGTPMFVVPNVKVKLGAWGNWYGGDHDFISATVQKFGGPDSVVWKEDVIAEIH